MTAQATKKTICSVCNKMVDIPIETVSETLIGRPDLDFRPMQQPPTAFHDWVQTCPECGYAARSISATDALDPSFLQSSSYLTCDGIQFENEPAKKFYHYYQLAKERQNLMDELIGLRSAAWACDDNNETENARRCRELALPVLEQLVETGDDVEDYHLMRMDFLRRCGFYHRLIDQYGVVKFDDDLTEKIRRFQIEKAAERDPARYNMQDVDKDDSALEKHELELKEYLKEQSKKVPIAGSPGFDAERATDQLPDDMETEILKASADFHARDPINRTWELSDDEISSFQRQIHDRDQSLEDDKSDARKSTGSMVKGIIIGSVIACLLIASFFGAKLFIGSENTADEDTVDKTSEEAGGITVVKDWNGSILASDWDWDSRKKKNGIYYVDMILFIDNRSESDIMKVEFSAISNEGEKVLDANKPDKPLSAQGYIPAGEKGFMVGKLSSMREKVRPNDAGYQVTAVYTNPAIKDYSVPTGTVHKWGDDYNNYDITISNPNNVEISQKSIIMIASVHQNRITGRCSAAGHIDDPIAPYSEYFQRVAFYDPNVHVDEDELKVYVLDTHYYNHCQ